MEKADVLAKLEEYKGRQIEVGLGDEGAVLYAGINGHWLFTEGDNLVAVKVNTTDGRNGTSSSTQMINPFSIMYVPFDIVNYVKSYINNEPGDISDKVSSLIPVGTDKAITDIIKEIESDPIRKALSPRGNLNVSDVAPSKSYGAFRGSVISTTSDGIPKFMSDALLNLNKESE